MRVLLDTHALLWWFIDDIRLSKDTRFLIEDVENSVFVSAASVWEIAWKVKSGRLPEAALLNNNILSLFDPVGFDPLPITNQHVLHAANLPSPHRDPFDRILAAQALVEDLALISTDRQMAGFGARVLW